MLSSVFASIFGLASSVATIWAILETYTAYQANPAAGYVEAAKAAARKNGIDI